MVPDVLPHREPGGTLSVSFLEQRHESVELWLSVLHEPKLI